VARIVIVEDDRDIRELIGLILDEDGYTIVAIATGADALQACRDDVPDLVLLDVSLPGELSGLEVCRRVRADERLAAVPVMLLTARARPDDVEAGYAAGASDYLVKPFNPGELIRRVEDLLGRAGR
jgi:two-component system, OmpR family, phosphate regulon response regulator PhoB